MNTRHTFRASTFVCIYPCVHILTNTYSHMQGDDDDDDEDDEDDGGKGKRSSKGVSILLHTCLFSDICTLSWLCMCVCARVSTSTFLHVCECIVTRWTLRWCVSTTQKYIHQLCEAPATCINSQTQNSCTVSIFYCCVYRPCVCTTLRVYASF